jgi:site-specific recombinase XerD
VRSTSIARDPVELSPRPAAAQQRTALPGPPTVEEIIAVMHAAGDESDSDAVRLRGLIVVLWRAGLRISEALALSESDLDLGRGAILVRRGKGGKRREVGMDRWAWDSWGPGCSCAPPCRSARCSAYCEARPPVARGRLPAYVHSFTTPPPEQE